MVASSIFGVDTNVLNAVATVAVAITAIVAIIFNVLLLRAAQRQASSSETAATAAKGSAETAAAELVTLGRQIDILERQQRIADEAAFPRLDVVPDLHPLGPGDVLLRYVGGTAVASDVTVWAKWGGETLFRRAFGVLGPSDGSAQMRLEVWDSPDPASIPFHDLLEGMDYWFGVSWRGPGDRVSWWLLRPYGKPERLTGTS